MDVSRKSRIIATEWDGILAGLLVKKADAINGLEKDVRVTVDARTGV